MKGKAKETRNAIREERIDAKPKTLYTVCYCWRSIARGLLALIRGEEEREGIKCGYLC